MPLWVAGIAFALILWRLAASVSAVRLPGKAARALIAFALVGAVFARFHTLNGLSPGTVLLVLMAAVKLLETHTRRDRYIVVAGSLFLLLAACLERQSLLRTPLYLLEAWLCCAALAVVAYTPERHAAATPSGATLETTTLGTIGSGFDNRAAVFLAGRALLYAAPLALVLFVFFPRLAGSFWALPRSEDAQTGLSDTMSPGSISQ
ncbi:MAG: DUF3488 domain-containing protein, partial [Steroidobacteraceae bacterium]